MPFMKHLRISATSPLERAFAIVGAAVSIGALVCLVMKKCNLMQNGCHCHGEFGDASGAPDMTMDFTVSPSDDQ